MITIYNNVLKYLVSQKIREISEIDNLIVNGHSHIILSIGENISWISLDGIFVRKPLYLKNTHTS